MWVVKNSIALKNRACKMDTHFKALISYQLFFTFSSQYYNKLMKTVILSEIISPHCATRKLAPSHSNCHCFPQATYMCPILLKDEYIIFTFFWQRMLLVCCCVHSLLCVFVCCLSVVCVLLVLSFAICCCVAFVLFYVLSPCVQSLRSLCFLSPWWVVCFVFVCLSCCCFLLFICCLVRFVCWGSYSPQEAQRVASCVKKRYGANRRSI